MALGHLPDDGQASSRSFDASADCPLKEFEDSFGMIRVDAGAVVENGDGN